MRIKVTDNRAELLTYAELTDEQRGEFEYVDDEAYEPRFVTIAGRLVDTFEMMTPPAHLARYGWHAIEVDTFFSAVVVEFLDGDDEGFVRTGLVTS